MTGGDGPASNGRGKLKQGDRIIVTDGTFEHYEGTVDNIDEAIGRVTVIIDIFGRPTPVALEDWQIEHLN
jgi:transcriptional antiterminator NusG